MLAASHRSMPAASRRCGTEQPQRACGVGKPGALALRTGRACSSLRILLGSGVSEYFPHLDAAHCARDPGALQRRGCGRESASFERASGSLPASHLGHCTRVLTHCQDALVSAEKKETKQNPCVLGLELSHVTSRDFLSKAPSF